jgi:hypothetical protein
MTRKAILGQALPITLAAPLRSGRAKLGVGTLRGTMVLVKIETESGVMNRKIAVF